MFRRHIHISDHDPDFESMTPEEIHEWLSSLNPGVSPEEIEASRRRVWPRILERIQLEKEINALPPIKRFFMRRALLGRQGKGKSRVR